MHFELCTQWHGFEVMTGSALNPNLSELAIGTLYADRTCFWEIELTGEEFENLIAQLETINTW